MIQQKGINMSDNFVSSLRSNCNILCGETLSNAVVRLYRLNYGNAHLASLPEDYWQTIAQINGIYYDGAEVYGLNSPLKVFKDLITQNQNLHTSHVVVLGENETDWLVYDAEQQRYQLVDKDEESVLYSAETLEKAINYILRL